MNNNSTISTHGAWAAADNITGLFTLSSPATSVTWSVTSGTYIALTLSSTNAPVAYPPLFLNNQSVEINRFDFINSQVTNAFDFLAQIGTGSQPPSPIGQAHIVGSQIYAANNVLTLTNQLEIFKIADSYFSVGTYGPATYGPTYNLRNWTITYGSWLNIANGTTSTTPIVQGLFTSHVFIFGYNKTVWVSTGHLDISNLDFSVDGVESVLEVDPTGQITNTTFTGASSGYWSILCPWSVSPPPSCSGVNSNPAVWVNAPTAGGSSLYFKNIFVDAVNGDLFKFVASSGEGIITEIENVTVSGAGPGGPNAATMIYYSGEGTNGGYLIARNNTFIGTYGNSNVNGITVATGALFADITGNEFFSLQTPITLGSSSTPFLVEGNTSHFTNGTSSITGAATAVVMNGNVFDKVPLPTPSACGTSPSVSANDNGVGTVIFGTGSPSSCTLTFPIVFGRTPRCTLTPETAGITAYLSAKSVSAITITLSTATSGAVIDYVCSG